MRTRLWALFAVVCCTSSASASVVIVPKIIKVWVSNTRVLVKYSDDVVKNLGHAKNIRYGVLKDILKQIDNVDDVAPLIVRLSSIRNKGVIPDMFHGILGRNMNVIRNVKNSDTVLRLLLSDNRAQVRGAYGELKRCLYLRKIKGLEVLEMRRLVRTDKGLTDIDLLMRYKGQAVIVEAKEYRGIVDLTPEITRKLDKLSELTGTYRVFISVGEYPPARRLLDYATNKGIHVLHGGNMQQVKLMENALRKISEKAL